MISIGARIVKTAIRLYTYPYRKRHLSLSRSIKFKVGKYTPPKGWGYSKKILYNVNVEILKPKDCRSDCGILHFHGGGHTVGMINLYRRVAEKYARLSGLAVYSIDYNTGTELRHPSLLDDVYNACIGLIESGIRLNDLIAIGDSMGANLMMAACLKLRNNRMTLPRGLIAISPAVDLAASGDSYRKNCYKDPMYSLPKYQKFVDYEEKLRRKTPYGIGADLCDPMISPAYGEYDNFPPILIQCGDCEISESDSDMLYDKLLSANVDVTLKKYSGMFHNFLYITPFIKESKIAWKDIIKFINNLLNYNESI